MIPWQFAHSEILRYLLAALLLPVIIWLIRTRETKKMAAIGSNWQNLVHHTYHLPRAAIRGFFLMASVACLIISLAKPRDGHEQIQLPTKSKNLMVAVDLSRSMLARDVPPSRLERAKREILDLTELWSPHKIGLMIFAGRAYVHLPLTQDLTMVRLFTKSLSVDMISEQGTDLTAAVKLALSSLTENQNLRTASKDLLIITDGEDGPKEVMTAAQQAKNDGVRIFTMGLGSPEGAPIRLPSGRYQRDDKGQIVISKLDESTLISLARKTGGHYVRSEAGNKDLAALYHHGLKHAKAVESVGQQESMAIYHERYMWPGWLSLILLVLSFLVTPYRPKHRLKALALSCLALASIYLHPSQTYGLTTPETPEAGEAKETFRSAARLLADGGANKQQLEEAEQALLSLTFEASDSLLHAVYYNLFHLYLQKNQIKEAHDAIIKAYSLRDNHQPTLENLKWIKELANQNSHSQDTSNSEDHSSNKNSNQNSEKNPQSGDKDSQQQPSHGSSQNQDSAGSGVPESQENNEKGQEHEDHHGNENNHENPAVENGSDSNQSEGNENQPGESSGQSTAEKTDDPNQAGGGDEGKENADANKPSAGTEDPDAMGSQQAESLFRSLEENLDIYGRKYHGQSSKNRPSKDW